MIMIKFRRVGWFAEQAKRLVAEVHIIIYGAWISLRFCLLGKGMYKSGRQRVIGYWIDREARLAGPVSTDMEM